MKKTIISAAYTIGACLITGALAGALEYFLHLNALQQFSGWTLGLVVIRQILKTLLPLAIGWQKRS